MSVYVRVQASMCARVCVCVCVIWQLNVIWRRNVDRKGSQVWSSCRSAIWQYLIFKTVDGLHRFLAKAEEEEVYAFMYRIISNIGSALI